MGGGLVHPAHGVSQKAEGRGQRCPAPRMPLQPSAFWLLPELSPFTLHPSPFTLRRTAPAADRNSSCHSCPPSKRQVVTVAIFSRNLKSFSNFSAVNQSSDPPRPRRTGGM